MDHVMNDVGSASDGAIAALGTVVSSVPRLNEEAVILSALWTELISGLCKIEQVRFSAQSCALVVTRTHRSAEAEIERLSERDIEILERSLVEGVRKSVAADFNLCPSSVAEILRRCFQFMGLSCWPSRMPLLLVMAAHAHRTPVAERGAKLVLVQNQQFARQVISATRPDNDLSVWLSPAEYAVTRLLIEGKSYAEIATLRNTSRRTVANQLASGFHRLRISGRPELLCLLSQRKLARWQCVASQPRLVSRAPLQEFSLASGEVGL